MWSPWWVTGGADPCATEVAFGLPPGGLPCSVADGAGPRVVSSVVQADRRGDGVDGVQDGGRGAADRGGDRLGVGGAAGGGGCPACDVPDGGVAGVQAEQVGQHVGGAVGLDLRGAAVGPAGRVLLGGDESAVRAVQDRVGCLVQQDAGGVDVVEPVRDPQEFVGVVGVSADRAGDVCSLHIPPQPDQPR